MVIPQIRWNDGLNGVCKNGDEEEGRKLGQRERTIEGRDRIDLGCERDLNHH